MLKARLTSLLGTGGAKVRENVRVIDDDDVAALPGRAQTRSLVRFPVLQKVCILRESAGNLHRRLHPMGGGSRTPVCNSQVVIFDQCHKGVVRALLHNDAMFPWVKVVVLNSHPEVASTIIKMEQRRGLTFIVHDVWWHYRIHWSSERRRQQRRSASSHIFRVDSAEYMDVMRVLERTVDGVWWPPNMEQDDDDNDAVDYNWEDHYDATHGAQEWQPQVTGTLRRRD